MFRALKNDELKIVVVVNVLEVIGKLDVHESKDSEVETQPVLEYDEKIMDIINDFEVLPSQVDLVRKIFEKHPNIALELRPKNPLLRKACMNFLLSLIETLCQLLGMLSNEDLVEADNALAYLKHSGFQVDFLKKNLDKAKDEQQIHEARVKESKVELKEVRQKIMDMEALVEIKKANFLAARNSLVWPDDVF